LAAAPGVLEVSVVVAVDISNERSMNAATIELKPSGIRLF